MTSTRVFVIGVGHTKFTRPGGETNDYPDLGAEALRDALTDAGIGYEAVEHGVASFVYGDSTSGQAAFYRVGLTGIPILNCNNNCASGSSALDTARRFVKSGSKCVAALGFEKMEAGLQALFPEKEHPAQRHFDAMWACGIPKKRFLEGVMTELTENVLKVYAHNAHQHMKRFGVTIDQIAAVSSKNHWHSQYNPNSLNQKPMTTDQVKSSRALFPPLTMGMAAPMASGAAAAILCNEEFVREHNLYDRAVEIVAQVMTSDTQETFSPTETPDPSRNLCGYDLSARAAGRALAEAKLSPQDIDVLEIHDAFASNELCTYSALKLCEEGKEGLLIDESDWITNSEGGKLFRLGKKWVVNPSGGLESKGHPVGATGLAQCAELVWQLRNEAGKRQVPGATTGLQHNYGWSSCAVVTIYRRFSTNNKNNSKL